MKYLIVGPSWVGDMVMAQPLFTTIKEQDNDARIDVLAPAWSAPLLERMPEVNRGLDMPLGHGKLEIGVRRQLGKELAANNYDQAIVLPNSLKSALVPFFASIPKRTGWKGEVRYGLLNDIRKLDKERYPLMIERFIALAYEPHKTLPAQLPSPALKANAESCTAARQRFNLAATKPVLALCPGAEFGPAKRWPERHYAEVARQKLLEGWQVWLFGSAKDKPGNEDIVSLIPEELRSAAHNIAGETSLGEAIDLLSCADAVVSNDSGLMHIAAALGRNLVVVYGSTSPEFTPPLNKNHRVLRLGLDCSPCFKRECPLGHLNCLNKLEPKLALNALTELAQEHRA
ncbi:lipopolysaccharide heptosyltransferase II [Sansalvadorimonas verongulae]|uniref:lipopolysaccharide heptosyltransferase II n=1 Tax=Sansalvadorimonas verongulae TaxID=2172824 RepID=UPI002E36BEB7|nr:lipopolysaccharide heptosyltransferase II [Sansalvadorimonas verongulae]MTI15287.1 lipopolysaccharide heptosyltransferase II [Sansalvadorimonas verongulae]